MKSNSKSKVAGTHCLHTVKCRSLFTVVALLLLLAAGAPRAFAWGITWSDDFTGVNNQPWSGNWSFETGGGANNEKQTYVTSWANCHVVSDGTGTDSQALQFEAQTDNGAWNGHWYSARINSYGHHSFGTGTYLEFRCKFPNSGKGYWPAAWCLGTSGGNWPYNGEIDVAEEVNGAWENYQTLHMPNGSGGDYSPGTGPRTIDHSTTTYHNYGVWIQPDGSYITFNVDGNNTITIYRSSTPGGASWEFNPPRQFFVILNLAIGGNFPGDPNSSTQVNGKFDVDYVHQWN
ncbi:MAG: 1,3-beta-glucanase [Pedosphaera sp.]|nr:1,3-beta-glucanase [Pedosphaera sp.]